MHIPSKHEKKEAGVHLNVVIWCECFRQLSSAIMIVFHSHMPFSIAGSKIILRGCSLSNISVLLGSKKLTEARSVNLPDLPGVSRASFFLCSLNGGRDNIAAFVSGKSFFLLVP